LLRRDQRLCDGLVHRDQHGHSHPVGVQAATIKVYMATNLRAGWTSTSAPKGVDCRLTCPLRTQESVRSPADIRKCPIQKNAASSSPSSSRILSRDHYGITSGFTRNDPVIVCGSVWGIMRILVCNIRCFKAHYQTRRVRGMRFVIPAYAGIQIITGQCFILPGCPSSRA